MGNDDWEEIDDNLLGSGGKGSLDDKTNLSEIAMLAANGEWGQIAERVQNLPAKDVSIQRRWCKYAFNTVAAAKNDGNKWAALLSPQFSRPLEKIIAEEKAKKNSKERKKNEKENEHLLMQAQVLLIACHFSRGLRFLNSKHLLVLEGAEELTALKHGQKGTGREGGLLHAAYIQSASFGEILKLDWAHRQLAKEGRKQSLAGTLSPPPTPRHSPHLLAGTVSDFRRKAQQNAEEVGPAELLLSTYLRFASTWFRRTTVAMDDFHSEHKKGLLKAMDGEVLEALARCFATMRACANCCDRFLFEHSSLSFATQRQQTAGQGTKHLKRFKNGDNHIDDVFVECKVSGIQVQ
jgi:hypothetical protein